MWRSGRIKWLCPSILHSSFFILHSAFAPRWLCWRIVGALWTHEGRMGVALYTHEGGFEVALRWLWGRKRLASNTL